MSEEGPRTAHEQTNDPEQDEDTNAIKADRGLNTIKWVAITAAAIAIGLSAILLIIENLAPNDGYSLSRMGAVGDFIGGYLNPLFSFLAIMGLILTLRLQQEELILTRRELKGSREANEALASAADRSNIETAFFQLLSVLNDVSDEVQTTRRSSSGDNSVDRGASAFAVLNERMHDAMQGVWTDVYYNEQITNPRFNSDHTVIKIQLAQGDEYSQTKILAEYAYSKIYSATRASLGQYFRVLYNVLRFLSEKRKQLDDEMFETYYKIVRANLSDYELTIIFFNCLTEVGRPMIKYVSEFQLFDNLPLQEMVYSHTGSHGEKLDSVDFLKLADVFPIGSFGRYESEVRSRSSNIR